eukprot:768408-Hanusia_phi.AAC.10
MARLSEPSEKLNPTETKSSWYGEGLLSEYKLNHRVLELSLHPTRTHTSSSVPACSRLYCPCQQLSSSAVTGHVRIRSST